MSGGWGAFSDTDGPGPYRSTTHGDVRDVPVEIQEAMYPYRIDSKQLRPGARAAPESSVADWVSKKSIASSRPLSLMNKMDRTRCPPWGLAGGGAASRPAGK